MKVIKVTVVAAVLIVGVSVVFPSHAKEKPEKELVCHVDDEGEIEAKMLPSKAARAHERHGDLPPMPFYLDADGDGFTPIDAGSIVACLPQGDFNATSESDIDDCNDNDPDLTTNCVVCPCIQSGIVWNSVWGVTPSSGLPIPGLNVQSDKQLNYTGPGTREVTDNDLLSIEDGAILGRIYADQLGSDLTGDLSTVRCSIFEPGDSDFTSDLFQSTTEAAAAAAVAACRDRLYGANGL